MWIGNNRSNKHIPLFAEERAYRSFRLKHVDKVMHWQSAFEMFQRCYEVTNDLKMARQRYNLKLDQLRTTYLVSYFGLLKTHFQGPSAGRYSELVTKITDTP